MTQIDIIKSPILEELRAFNNIFETAFTASDPLLKSVMHHVKQRSGKQIRPILVILSAKLCGDVTPKTYQVAASFELLHTASLIHDDVVDNFYERRQQPSVNALFDNKTAVLVGDYLLTSSMDYMARTANFQLVNCLVQLGKEVTQGELLQLEKAYKKSTEEDYFEIIRKKTAMLFAVCTEGGAISANATIAQQQALHNFGEKLGICFQIKDDIFDYSPKAKIGKPTLNDIREGKITLPLIHALEQASEAERHKVSEILSTNEFNVDNLSFIHQLVTNYQGHKYAEK